MVRRSFSGSSGGAVFSGAGVSGVEASGVVGGVRAVVGSVVFSVCFVCFGSSDSSGCSFFSEHWVHRRARAGRRKMSDLRGMCVSGAGMSME